MPSTRAGTKWTGAAVIVSTGLLVSAPVQASDRPAAAGTSIATRGSQTCFAAEPTIVGAPGQKVIHGTPGDDVIVGGPAIKIYGHRGNDRICNQVRGYEESDPFPTLDGGLGNDRLAGSFTPTHGETAPFFLFGRGGRDRLRGGTALLGGRGGDVLISTGQGPYVHLGDGPGDDIVQGGPTTDEFNLGPGANTITGSTEPRCPDPFCDFLAVDEARVIDLRGGYVRAAGDRSTLADIHKVVVNVLDHPVTVRGSSERDVLSGYCRLSSTVDACSTTELTLVGRGGADWLIGGNGDDSVGAGGGDDHLKGLRGGDTLTGGAGDDTLNGGPGPDTCRDNLGTNTFRNCE